MVQNTSAQQNVSTLWAILNKAQLSQKLFWIIITAMKWNMLSKIQLSAAILCLYDKVRSFLFYEAKQYAVGDMEPRVLAVFMQAFWIIIWTEIVLHCA